MTVRYLSALAAAIAAVLALAACGGGSGSNNRGTTSSKPGTTSTVSMQKVGSAGDVLVDARGDALYSADQEAGGKIRCTGTCTTIWLPLTVAHGATPTAGNGVSASKLGVVSRPDGKQQVTWNGRPLYRFAQDGGPGKVTGNGAMDSFGGTSFSWHVAAMSGSATTTTTPKSGYGY